MGIKARLLTGLGSSTADCLYAIIGAFGLTLVSDFLLKYQLLIQLLGGALIFLMGLRLLLKKSEITLLPAKAIGGAKIFLSSFVIGITNPAAILTFVFAFSYFGIFGVTAPAHGTALVVGVFLGTYFW